MQKRVLLGIVLAVIGLDYYIKENITQKQARPASAQDKAKLLQIKPSRA